MRKTSMPVALANARSLTANGLCVLIAASSRTATAPARNAHRAASMGASGMNASAARLAPNPTSSMRMESSRLSSRALSAVVTTIAALPSAGCV